VKNLLHKAASFLGAIGVADAAYTRVLDLRSIVDPEARDFRRAWSRIQRIEGLLVPGQEEWLFRAARRLPDGAAIVEIGSYKGRSTTALASACVGTTKHVYAVDTFNGNDSDFSQRDFLPAWKESIESNGIVAWTTAVPGISWEVGANWEKPIGMLFIDGSHQFEDVLKDFDAFFPHVVSGGIVAMHDVTEGWPGPLRAWREVVKPKLSNTGAYSSLAFGTKP